MHAKTRPSRHTSAMLRRCGRDRYQPAACRATTRCRAHLAPVRRGIAIERRRRILEL
jgi:hypothetical protein